jgi:hypothetical protein
MSPITKAIKKKVLQKSSLSESPNTDRNKDDKNLLKSVKQRFKEQTKHQEPQIMDKTINMDEYVHSTTFTKNLSTKCWLFVKENESYSLSYTYGWDFVKYSGINDHKTGWYRNDSWFLKTIGERDQKRIYNINDWIKTHQIYFEEYRKNYMEMETALQELRKSSLGEVSFSSMYEVGWYVKNEYLIKIDKIKFPKGINVGFKDSKNKSTFKTKIMNKSELVTFILKNQKKIQKIKEEESINHKKKLQILQEQQQQQQQQQQQLEPISKDQAIINMIRARPGIDNESLYYRSIKNKNCMFIKSSLKHRYEVQACKPLPENREIVKELQEMEANYSNAF